MDNETAEKIAAAHDALTIAESMHGLDVDSMAEIILNCQKAARVEGAKAMQEVCKKIAEQVGVMEARWTPDDIRHAIAALDPETVMGEKP